MTYSHTSSFGTRAFAVLTALALLMSVFPAGFMPAEAHHEEGHCTEGLQWDGSSCVEKLTICHATGSGYVTNEPSRTADAGGHAGGSHQDGNDIIPPFEYEGGSFTGQNWDEYGEAVWENGCSNTLELHINKHISGDQNGFELSDFSYRVTGSGVDEVVPHDDTIDLEIGTYSIEEIVPAGFVKEDWRIGWYGECESGDAYSTEITFEAKDLGASTPYECEADNQYRPGDDNGGDDEGCTDPDADNYDPDADVDDGSCEFPPEFCDDPEAENYGEEGECEYDDGGGNGTSTDEYLVFGYVWHDENENDEWDGIDNEASTTEDDLEGWTVEITNGDDTFSTITDEDGYYEFMVPAGTWTINEVVMNGWSQTFPNVNGHVVTVPEEEEEELALLDAVLNFLIPTAHAQQAGQGPFNFGNVQTSNNGGGGNNLSCTLSADRTDVRENSKVNLTWTTNNATSVEIDNGVGTTTATGTLEVVVPSDTTYVLTASDGNSTTTCSVSIDTDSGGGDGGGCSNCGGSNSSGGGGGGGSNSNDDDDDDSDPTPQVLGEQVSAIPTSAPNAGAGGTSPQPVSFGVTLSGLLVLLGRKLLHLRA